MNRFSDSSALLSGILFLVLAGIVASVGLMWMSFIEFPGGKSAAGEVFASLSAQPAAFPADPNERKKLVFGFLVARGDLVKFIEAVQPSLNAIVRPIGFHAIIDVPDTIGEMLKKMEKGEIQIGAVTAVTYAKIRSGGKIRAILERTGKVGKKSLFIVKSDSAIKGLNDLKGLKIAYKTRESMSGYVIPLIEMKSRGIDPSNFFRSEIFSGNSRSSVLGLISGEFDCAVISNTFFDELEPATRKALRVVHASEAVPGGVYIAPAEKDREIVDKIADGFLSFGAGHSRSDEFSGFFTVGRPDPALYDFLEQVSEDDGN